MSRVQEWTEALSDLRGTIFEHRDSPDNCGLCDKLRREGCPECEVN